jgi:hypothetical protein
MIEWYHEQWYIDIQEPKSNYKFLKNTKMKSNTTL